MPVAPRRIAEAKTPCDQVGAKEANPSTTFIVGPSRCGTTLLAFLLGGGAGVMSVSEPFLARSIYGPFRHRWHRKLLAKKQKLRFEAPPASSDPTGFLHYLSRQAALNGMESLVVKETYRQGGQWDNIELLDWVAGLGCPIVGITRHPFDSAVSTLRMYRWWRGPLGYAARCWVPILPLFHGDESIAHYFANNWVGFGRWAQRQGVQIVRYEDLVRRTEETVESICGHVRLKYDPSMADSRAPRRAFGGIGAPEVSNRKPRAVHARSVGRKKELPPHLLRIIQSTCGQAAGELGYEL